MKYELQDQLSTFSRTSSSAVPKDTKKDKEKDLFFFSLQKHWSIHNWVNVNRLFLQDKSDWARSTQVLKIESIKKVTRPLLSLHEGV